MRNSPGLTKFAPVFIALIQGVSLTTEGQSPSPANRSKAPASMLPRNVVISLSKVNRLFPEVTREASTGYNLTAVANPKATRSVSYTNTNSAKKVTITMDQYPTASAASSAYQEAVTKSKAVPGFRQVPVKNLGPNAFVGTVTQRGETHIGLGALRDMLIVGVTLAGYNSTPENIERLISLTREQERLARSETERND
jgi:hypothetical protein